MFADVVGQEGAIDTLQRAAGRPVHAYLLVGPRGSGVEDAARDLAQDPDLVHRFYDARRAALTTVEPNAAHRALARLDAAWPGQLLIANRMVFTRGVS